MTTPATFPSPGPSFAAGTAAGGTLILFGCDLSSITANLAGVVATQRVRFGRGRGIALPSGLSPVHNLKLIPSFFGFLALPWQNFHSGK